MDFNLFKQLDSIVDGNLLAGEFAARPGRPAISAAGAVYGVQIGRKATSARSSAAAYKLCRLLLNLAPLCASPNPIKTASASVASSANEAWKAFGLDGRRAGLLRAVGALKQVAPRSSDAGGVGLLEQLLTLPDPAHALDGAAACTKHAAGE